MRNTYRSRDGLRKEYFETYFVVELPTDRLPARWGIVTSYNRDGQITDEETNCRVDAKLKRFLESSHVRHFRVTGGSRDGRHREPGFGIVIADLSEIDKLARQFRQEAFFWIQEGDVYCVKVGDPKKHRVGPWSQRGLDKWL